MSQNSRGLGQAGGRYALLDELRGLTFISMFLYHAAWDLVYLFAVPWRWYAGPIGTVWQQSICWTFILLSGFCAPLGRNTLRRGAVVFAAGWLVTAATALVMPTAVVWFGVLTLLGSCMMLVGLTGRWLRRVPPWAGLAASAVLFALTREINGGMLGFGRWVLAVLPQELYRNYFTAYLGFPPSGFFSTDYFSLLPWFFLYLVGYYLHLAVGRERMEPLRRSVCPPLGWIGRHSLVLYLLHQPVIYLVFSVLAGLLVLGQGTAHLLV